MSKIFDVITFFPKYLYFKKTCCKEANFADIIKVSTYLWEQYNLYLHFLILKNFLISDEKILISAELKGCVKWPPHLWVATKRLILNRVKASSFSTNFHFILLRFWKDWQSFIWFLDLFFVALITKIGQVQLDKQTLTLKSNILILWWIVIPEEVAELPIHMYWGSNTCADFNADTKDQKTVSKVNSKVYANRQTK